jgi:transposase
VYVYKTPVDMRKSYDGLYGMARASGNVLQGDVYLFVSRDRRRAKALFWDGNGVNIWMKRLEEGQFANVFERGEITASELNLFFEGSSSVVHRLSARDLTERFAS